jgi:putative copper resistance protein D
MSVDILSVTLRALSFVALFQAAGIALFLALFGRQLSACVEELQRLGRNAAAIAAGLLIAQYLLEAARMAGGVSGVTDASLQSLVLHSSVATTLAWRVVGMALVFVGLRGTSSARATSIVGATVAIAAFTLMGHTSTHADRWLLSVLLLAHLLIVAFWFGALMPLYLATKRESAAVAGTVTAAFSRVALWLVPWLFAAGVVLAAFILKNLAGLFTTYGALLVTKVAGFALPWAPAAHNTGRLGPARGRGEPRPAATFQRSLAGEFVLIVAVLSVTAVMTSFYSPD